MNETRSTFKNQESALRNLENQVGQLAKDLGQLTRSTNTFPSDTVVNPKEECKAVTLRSGKVLVDNSDKEVKEKGEDKIVKDSPVKSTTAVAKPLSAPSSSLQIPFPQRLRKDEVKETRMSLQLADKSIKFLFGVVENILVKVGKFILPADF
ncbi:hypothetical protein PIB30_092988, partial [Stylosanthes scabra]|nr:hypothetical protein [Stylosanthes scabra]